MLVLINKYLRSSKDDQDSAGSSSRKGNQQLGMPPGSHNDHHNMCIPGCVPVRATTKRAAATTTTVTTTTARASRHNFVKAAASGLLAGAHFTNHESLPSLPDAYAEFAAAFPQYGAVARADAVRGDEYGHLDRHVCLDYTGINLFSHAQMNASTLTSTSSSSSAPAWWQPPFFDIAYKSTSLRTQVQQCGAGGRERGAAAIGPAVTRRIMASLKIPEDEYTMVPTANRTTAFRLLAESYSFGSSSSSGGGGKHLLTVYDYESEAAAALSTAARRRGADVASATFAWPSMRIHAADLRKKLSKGRLRKGHHRGLFVFPLASRMTGARYPYLWMSAAQERGWHVALDACASGTKDLDTLGVSLLRPDFIVCNFFKVFGENPSGFAGLFVKKSSLPALERSVVARSIGVVTIVPARRWSLLPPPPTTTTYNDDEGGGGYSTELDHSRSFPDPKGEDENEEFDDVDTSVSFSGPLSAAVSRNLHPDPLPVSDEIREVHDEINGFEPESSAAIDDGTEEEEASLTPTIECRGLDHADALGLVGIGNRLRCVSNWLVVALQKLRHPSSSSSSSSSTTTTTTNHHGHALVRVYGPRVKFERGPSLAFNVFDWKGERVAPPLVQKLADRHAIALTCGFIRNIWFADKYEADRALVLERRPLVSEDEGAAAAGNKRKAAAAGDVGVFVVNASLGFLSNFEDAYRLWAFVAKFLDADFVEKERWRYTALNQRTVEV